jgi:hypothetical protein
LALDNICDAEYTVSYVIQLTRRQKHFQFYGDDNTACPGQIDGAETLKHREGITTSTRSIIPDGRSRPDVF